MESYIIDTSYITDIIDLYVNDFDTITITINKNNVINFVENCCSEENSLREIENMFSEVVLRKGTEDNIKNGRDNWYTMMDVLIKYHPDFFAKYVKLDKIVYKNLLKQKVDTEEYIKYKETLSIIQCYFAGIIGSKKKNMFKQDNKKLLCVNGIQTISKMYKYLYLLSETRVFQYTSIKGKEKKRYNNIFETECRDYYAFKYWKMYLQYKIFIRNVIQYYAETNELKRLLELCDTIIDVLNQEGNISLAHATIHELKRNKNIIKSSVFHNRFRSYSQHFLSLQDRLCFYDATSLIIKFQTTENPTTIYNNIIQTKKELINSKHKLSFDVSQIDIDVYNTLLGNEN